MDLRDDFSLITASVGFSEIFSLGCPTEISGRDGFSLTCHFFQASEPDMPPSSQHASIGALPHVQVTVLDKVTLQVIPGWLHTKQPTSGSGSYFCLPCMASSLSSFCCQNIPAPDFFHCLLNVGQLPLFSALHPIIFLPKRAR